MEITTIKISKETSKQLAEILKILRVFPTKKSFVEEIVSSFYTILKKFKESGAVFVLFGNAKLTKQGLLFPIAGISEVVFGVIPCKMDVPEEEADKLVEKEIKKKFKELSKK